MPGNESPEATFGEELKRHRLLREVSLESIASATKISVRHLQALERGDVQRLPAPVFTRGFIRAYADFLGLEPEELVNAYLSEVGGSGRAQSIGAEPRLSRAPSKGLVVLAVVAVAVAALIAAGIWRHAHRSRPVPARSAVLPPVSLSPHIRQVPVSSDIAAAVPQTPAPSTADASPAPVLPGPAAAAGPGPLADAATDSLSLSIRLEADCWGEVFGDDRRLFSGTFRRGDERTFEARKAFRVTFGNAGAARISVNGRALPPLGRPGEVVRNFRIDSGRVQEILSGRG
jgi:cytoskeletal protein RodZ